jgi:hypothetical protein
MSANESVIRNLADDPHLAVAITMGVEGWRAGEIALTVRGDGSVAVHQRRAGEERDYAGRIASDRVRRLGEELADDELTELTDSGGSRIPDDVPITIRVLRDGEVLHEATVRHSDRWKDERLDRLVRRYEALVSELTDGELPYGKPA